MDHLSKTFIRLCTGYPMAGVQVVARAESKYRPTAEVCD
jgi:hypothetical protein